MALTVLKFGGSSLAGAERLSNAAEKIAAEYDRGNRVIAVLSARGDTTDRLLLEARAISAEPPLRELDLLLSSGEQIAVAHMAMQLAAMGYPVRAFTGWQAGIRTDAAFGDARVHHVTGGRILRAVEAKEIVLVAGFQGISEAGDITTLGRGGSDTTAVALAAFLHADACRIYTDVDGVYTADPRILPEARKLTRISYGDMLEMAEQGAKVLHSRCVELAQEHGLEFEVCSSLHEVPGTIVAAVEALNFCGVAVKQEGDAARVSLIGCGCSEQEAAAQVLRALSPLTLLRFERRARCISATVPAAEADEAARTLHYLFLS